MTEEEPEHRKYDPELAKTWPAPKASWSRGAAGESQAEANGADDLSFRRGSSRESRRSGSPRPKIGNDGVTSVTGPYNLSPTGAAGRKTLRVPREKPEKANQEQRANVRRIRRLMEIADNDGNGTISRDEFAHLLALLDPSKWGGEAGEVKRALLDKLFDEVDADKNGVLDIQELMDMVFGAGQVDPYDSESDIGSSSSSEDEEMDSSVVHDKGSKSAPVRTLRRPGGNGRKPSKRVEKDNSAHLRKRVEQLKKYEEPLTTLSEMYELLTMRGGVTGGKAMLEDVFELFVESKLDGLGPKLATLIPQQCEAFLPGTLIPHHAEPEDVSPVEFLHLYDLLLKKPEATAQDAMKTIADVRDASRAIDVSKRKDRERVMAERGLKPDAPVGFKLFCQLLELLATALCVDEAHVLSVLVWGKTCRFEMTDAMAVAVMEKAFLKNAKGGGHVLEQPITENDFIRMCYSMQLIDNSEKQGLAHGKLGLIFGAINKKFAHLLVERHQKRYSDRGVLPRVPRRRRHHHNSIIGRTQLSVLIEELYKSIPCCRTQWRSPHNLVLSFMEASKGEGGRVRLYDKQNTSSKQESSPQPPGLAKVRSKENGNDSPAAESSSASTVAP